MTHFLPMTRAEMRERGWDALDILLVSGDAYVDHPGFAVAMIGRVLEAAGYRVGIVAQPDWRKEADFTRLGRPRLFAGVAAGAMDSMVANYTANRKIRRDDAYTPGGKAGRRPNYATVVYTNRLRAAFKGLPIVLGGIEASLRRFAHYDYWKDKVRRSILLDAKADLIVSGMGEKAALEIARRLSDARAETPEGPLPPETLQGIPGTVASLPLRQVEAADWPDMVRLPDFAAIENSPRGFLDAAVQLEKTVLAGWNRPACGTTGPMAGQRHGDRVIVEWAPEMPTQKELDSWYELPFHRAAHPSYREPIPALEPVRFSIVSHRGCFGGCAFCALSLHQGRRVLSRSEASIVAEARRLTKRPDFKGVITDVGGPTANMYGQGPRNQDQCTKCSRPSCLYPAPCPNLDCAHAPQARLLKKILAVPGIKHVFIASGIRPDLLLDNSGKIHREARDYFDLLVARLVGGQLSLAPEHTSARVLQLMRKPGIETYEQFHKHFKAASHRKDKKQYLIPYFISSFPGATDADAAQMAEWAKKQGRRFQQMQDFMPGPMTLAAAMYHAESSPEGNRLFVAKKGGQRQRQREAVTGPLPPGKAHRRKTQR